jgi:nitrite reductase/ring-hydroxylating ferredoxin subunit
MTVGLDRHLRLGGAAAGWYALAFADELGPGTVLRRRALDQELAVFRTASGVPAVMDGYCPHLGAHLAEGGRVVGEELRCPFHGLGFAPDGRCVRTAYRDARLPALRARTWQVQERHGVVLAFLGGAGDAAAPWDLHPIAPARAAIAWSAPAGRLWRIRTHPQEVLENTVDVGHFAAVHRYQDIDVVAPVAVDGPHLTMSYAATRRWAPGLRTRFRLDITASGLGYSRVEIHGLPLPARTVVMPTPVDGEITEVRVITQIGLLPEHRLTRALPRQWLADHIVQLAAAEMGRDFAADIRIWEHKRYLERPRLIDGDGPIGRYRRWARQFYPGAARPSHHVEVS